MIALRSVRHTSGLDLFTRGIKFGVVGGSGIAVNLAILVLLHGGLALPLLVVVPLAVEASIINNFAWNNVWTFAERTGSYSAFFKFNASCFAGLLISTTAVNVLTAFFGFNYLVADLAGICMGGGANFMLSNNWAWQSGQA